ncbi:MAG: hypothetical protein WA732_22475, partial [Pseudolabrys sp.]
MPRLRSPRIAAARLGMRLLKRKSSSTISSSPDRRGGPVPVATPLLPSEQRLSALAVFRITRA